MVAVLDEERDRAAQRAAVADAAERPHVVLLELLARAAAVARLAAGEVAADQLVVELDARGHAADDDRQARSVRLAGGDVGELHRVAKPIRARCRRGQEPLARVRLQFGAPRADEHDGVFGVIRAIAVVAAIAVAAGCGQTSGSDSVVHPATFLSDGQAQGGTGAAAKMPSQADATKIVRELWALRENVIDRLDATGFASLEVGAAQSIDSSYVRFVLCGCNQPKAGHQLQRVIPIVPKSSSDGTFMAEVQTINTATDDRPWYILGFRRVDGQWKIAFITLGGFKAEPPVQLPTTRGLAPMTRATHAQTSRMATSAANYAATQGPANSTTSYGAAVHSQILVRPQSDGVFGAAIGPGLVLGCYTVHQVDTYSLASGISQDAGRRNWGPQPAGRLPGDPHRHRGQRLRPRQADREHAHRHVRLAADHRRAAPARRLRRPARSS